MSPSPAPREISAAKPAPREFPRFSLLTLFVVTTLFAIWCAFVAIIPVAFSQILVGAFWFAATGVLVTGIVFAKGDPRAFCIGAALVASSMWTGLGGHFMQGIHQILPISQQAVLLWLDMMVIGATAVANGWCCVWARRFFERSGKE